MIHRLYRSKSDIENLSKLRITIPKSADNFDYRGVVVNKPWGYEYLLYQNSHVSIWILFLKLNHKTSMHCHLNKKTSLVVLSGHVTCMTLEGFMELKEDNGLIIEEAVFHSTRGTSGNGAFIMEIEFPPNKRDLVRLKDEYGREFQEYEGSEKMSKDLAKYEYIDFHNQKGGKNVMKELRTCQLTLSNHRKNQNITKYLKKANKYLLCMLDGTLIDKKGEIILTTGETGLASEICNHSGIITGNNVTYLTVCHRKDLFRPV